MAVNGLAVEFVLRTLASVTPQYVVLSKHTPRYIGEAAERLGFDWCYEGEVQEPHSIVWGILTAHSVSLDEAIESLCTLRGAIATGGWIIVTVFQPSDPERRVGGANREHLALESHGLALAADVNVRTDVLTTIVRVISGVRPDEH